MIKEKTPEEVYDMLLCEGAYLETETDKEIIKKTLQQKLEDFQAGKILGKGNSHWRVIFNINYDIISELCSALMLFSRIKCSNHEGIFAYITLNYPGLDFSWEFLEALRAKRNRNLYEREDVTEEYYKNNKLQIELYISTLKEEIERLLRES